MNGLTPRKAYKPSRAEREHFSVPLETTSINDRSVIVGVELTLVSRPALRSGRYEVVKIEREASGEVLLTVYGPLRKRRPPSQHYVRPAQVAVVHVKTKGNRAG